MKTLFVNRKVIVLILLTVSLIFGIQAASHSFFGDIIGGIVDVVGAVGEAVGAAAEGIGAAFVAAGEAVTAAAKAIGITIRAVGVILWHTDSLNSIELFPNGGLIGVVVSDLIHLWDVSTEQTTATLKHDAAIRSIAVSLDGGLLASAGEDGNVQLWNPNTETLLNVLRGHTDKVLDVAFSPDGTLLASASEDNTIRLWDPNLATLQATLKDHTDNVLSLAFSPDGTLLVSASADGTVRVWNPNTHTLQETLTEHTNSVLSVTFNQDGSRFASASTDGTVQVWDTNTYTSQAYDHETPVLSIAFSPVREILASGSSDGAVRLLDLGMKKVIAKLGHESPVRNVAYSPDGSMLFSTSEDGNMRKWEITSVDTTQSISYTQEGNPTITTSVQTPLTEATLNGSVVTLTLTGAAFERSTFRVRDGVTVSGIDGVTVGAFDIDRISDTEVTVELTFSGNIDTDKPLVFTVGAEAIANYDGTALTGQLPVTAVVETLVATTETSLTEATLHGSVVTITLNNRKFARSIFDIRGAVSVSGIGGVTIPWHEPDRESDTVITIELAFDGNMNTDSTLTFTVEARAIENYNGPTLTAEIPVTVNAKPKTGTESQTETGPSTNATVSISPASVASPTIGQQLEFSLNIADGKAVAGYQATVQFDTTALRFVSGANGEYLPVGAFFVKPVVEGNLVKLNAASLEGESDGDGTLATLTFEVIAAKASTLTLSDVLLTDSEGTGYVPNLENAQITKTQLIKGDVNGDGIVDIRDLVLVASNLGKTGQNAADVNTDGIVDIRDLVLVAGALGTSAAAPSLNAQFLSMHTAADLKKWLSEAEQLTLTDAASLQGIQFLEQLFTALTPKETALLANYPNPFNPETWIPYRLSKPSDVTLTIYSMRGVVVRQLKLGHKTAGVYTSRTRAAYWDGKNEFGEKVANGVYFYRLTADDFSATRKMLIRK